jgi:large subunit ribosomal protein L21
MFAVIKTGGKQYRVAAGDVIEVERLPAEAGTAFEFTEVLAVGGEQGVRLGRPLVDGARVSAEVVAQMRGPKLTVFKKRRRQNSRRKNSHRQDLTKVKITAISAA